MELDIYYTYYKSFNVKDRLFNEINKKLNQMPVMIVKLHSDFRSELAQKDLKKK